MHGVVGGEQPFPEVLNGAFVEFVDAEFRSGFFAHKVDAAEVVEVPVGDNDAFNVFEADIFVKFGFEVVETGEQGLVGFVGAGGGVDEGDFIVEYEVAVGDMVGKRVNGQFIDLDAA